MQESSITIYMADGEHQHTVSGAEFRGYDFEDGCIKVYTPNGQMMFPLSSVSLISERYQMPRRGMGC